jgi:dTDP-4-amino-4,6-dideoxygalactose transaminase
MKVPLLDLKAQYQTVKKEVLKATEEIFESQYFILGPHVATLEESIVDYCRTPFAVGVSSGTDALLISLMASNIATGDIVLTTPFTFFATAGSIVRTGAMPVFADIDPKTFNLSPERCAEVIEKMPSDIKSRLKAIMPVHLYGQCADMDPILEIAKTHKLTVIEDAAQAIGSQYKGRRAGSMGHFGCFSFFPSKNLGAFGDGGIVTTQTQEHYERLKILRVHGGHPKYYHQMIGGNFRLDALQAAIVGIKLKHLDSWTSGRQKNAKVYRQLFADANLTSRVVLPEEKEDRHIYNQFVIRVSDDLRDDLRNYLANADIGTEIYYPVPLHLQKCFANLGYKSGDFPVSEQAAKETIALPIYPELTENQLGYVVEKIAAYFKG